MTAVYDAWCGLVSEHAGLVGRVAARHGLSAERLLQSSLLCVALHDVGKLSRNFQRMMRAADKAAYRDAVRENYRHEVAALWFVNEVAASALPKQYGKIPGDGRLEALAVAGHHRYLADGYLLDDEKFQQSLSWEPDPWAAVQAAYALAVEMFRDRGWRLPGLSERMKPFVEKRLCHQLGGANYPYNFLLTLCDDLSRQKDAQEGRFRELFLLLKGLLMTADWMASGAHGHEEMLDASRSVVRVEPDALEEHLRARVELRRQQRPDLKLAAFKGYRNFQARCGSAEGHVLAIAPTGSGKTEAALLWALGQVKRGHARKVLVLLPTMVTANSIHERFCAFFEVHGHPVGLVHSTADLVKRESRDDVEEADRADVRAHHLSETHLFRPVTVGTVDQLLVPLFHAGRWALKTLGAADAAIVIDEIHAYEPHTLGLIVLMIRQLLPLGARFLLMSATMPRALKEVLHESLGSGAIEGAGITVIEDHDLLNSARNTWEACDIPLTAWLLSHDAQGRPIPSTDFLDLWRRRNDRGKPLKILIVVNTVKRCQDLSRSLREFGLELVCYHSKFIFDHRREKERQINEDPPRLLIATQVVEVSLDIDYDVLLTECAPIDALVQRAGRVNRVRRKTLGRVIVHPHEEGSEKVYGSPPENLAATWGLCQGLSCPPTERDLIGMVETVYAGRDYAGDDAFRRIQSATRETQRRLSGILDAPKPKEQDAQLKTRPEDYLQVSVIPDCFAGEARSGPPQERRLYELKVPAWYARSHRHTDDDLPICKMAYGPEYGAEFIATSDHSEPGHEII